MLFLYLITYLICGVLKLTALMLTDLTGGPPIPRVEPRIFLVDRISTMGPFFFDQATVSLKFAARSAIWISYILHAFCINVLVAT